jgi:hypothetical protein
MLGFPEQVQNRLSSSFLANNRRGLTDKQMHNTARTYSATGSIIAETRGGAAELRGDDGRDL